MFSSAYTTFPKTSLGNLKGIYIRYFISEKNAPNFLMCAIEMESNAKLELNQFPYASDIYILQGELTISHMNQSIKKGKKDDFLFIPENSNYTLKNTANNTVILLQVYQKEFKENPCHFDEFIHQSAIKFSSHPVTDYGSMHTTIQVFNTPKEKYPFIMRKFEIKPQGNIGYHSHDWEHEMFMLAGQMTLIDDKGQHKHELYQNDFIFMPPNEPHGYLNEKQEQVEFICVIPNSDYQQN